MALITSMSSNEIKVSMLIALAKDLSYQNRPLINSLVWPLLTSWAWNVGEVVP